MRGKFLKWQKLEDVPQLIVEWATSVSDKSVDVNEIIELVSSFEDWSDNIQNRNLG